MALALCLTLLPTAALAEGTEGTAQTPPAVEKAADPANGEEQQENQPAAPKQENQSAEQEEQQEDSAAKQAVATVQALIDALPAVDELDGMDDGALDAAYMDTQAAYDAYEALTAEQQAQITGAERFEDLFNWFNGQIALLDGDVTIYPDDVNANGDIIPYTDFSRTGPLLTGTETTLSGQYYVVQGTVTIDRDLTVDGSQDGGLVLCQGAKLTINGALIHTGGKQFYIYGQSNNGADTGELIINNSNGDGAAIRTASTYDARLGINSGKVTVISGISKELIGDHITLYSTKPIHEGILDGDAKLPSEWGNSSILGGNLVLEYCGHDHAAYTPSGSTQHIKSCAQCGFNTGSSPKIADCGSDGYDRYVSVDDTNHRQKCPCGNTFGNLIPHDTGYLLSKNNQMHIAGCAICGYQSGSEEQHVWDNIKTGECVRCGFMPVAAGDYDYIFESVQDALDAFANGDTISAELHSAKSGNTEIRDAIVFDYPGKTLTLNMKGYALVDDGHPVITVKAGTLKITGDAIINQIAAGAELITPAIRVTGGELIFENNLTVTGGKAGAMVGSAIEVTGNGTVTFQGEVNATAQLIDSTTSDPDLSPAIKVTGGTVTFAQKLTATGGRYDDKANRKQQQPAVSASGGTLDFQNGLELNGGLTLTGDAALKNKLTQGTFTAIEGIDVRRVSVDGSNPYKRIADLLEDGYAFADNNKALVEAGGSYNIWTISDLTIVPHTHDWKPDSTYTYLHRCACGASDNHSDWKDGKCEVCGYECPHKQVDTSNGTCEACHMQMKVRIENDNTTTYSTDFKAAMKAAENGTTVTLLADIEWGVTPQDRAAITGDGKIVTLNLNGHTITGGWLDVGSYDKPTSCTLKIIGEGSHESLGGSGGYSGVFPKATLDLSEWEGGTINAINISDNSNYEAETREAAVIVGPNAGTIGKLTFGNNQLGELKKTKLSGGSFNEIWAANNQPVKLSDLLADGYAFQKGDGSYVEYGTTLKGASIGNVKVVKCLHPNMKPGEDGVATCEYCGKSGKFVASVDGNLYTDMDEAITYWLANGGTLKLYADYTAANGTWSIGSGSHTINLNGHKMSVQGDGAFFKPTNNMHLTVIDGTEIGQIENILLDGNQGGSFTLESGYVGNLEMTDGAVVALKGGSVDKLDVQNCTASTNLSIQGGSLGELNIKDWADGMHVSATGGSLGAYTLPSGKILADVLDHQYYAEGTSLDRQEDTAQPVEKFVINQAPHDFESTSKAADVPINGSIPFMVDSPSGDATGYYDVRWYRRTNSGAEHMTQNRVAGVNVGDTLDVFCVITGADRPGGAMKWQVAVKGYTINVVPAKLNGDTTEIEITNKDTLVYDGKPLTADVKVTYNDKELTPGTDYTVSGNTGTDAKTYTLTITGKGNYGGEQSKYWTIKPRALGYPEITALTRKYDGTTALPGDFTLSKFKILPDDGNGTIMTLTQGKDFMLNGNYGDASVGENKAFTITITLRDNYHNGSGGNEMTLIQKDYTGLNASITKADAPKNAAGSVAVMNKHANDYEFDLAKLLPTLEAPREYGAVTYGAPTVNLSSGYYTDGARVEDGKLILPIRAVETKETGSIGSVKVNVSTTNYHDFTLTINVIAKNRITPTGTPTLSKNAITYGDALNTIALSGKLHDNVNNVDVDGTFEWVDGTHIPVVGNGTYAAEWIFEPTDTEKYLTVSGRSNITVEKAQQYGKVSMAGYTYGQTPSTPTLTDRTGDGSVTYYYSTTNSNSGGTKWENIQADTLNAGTYYMYAELGETENYGSFTTACVKFRVVRAMPTYTAPTGLTAKYGQTLADVTLPNDWSWMDSSESVGGASTAAKKFMAKFTPTDTDNYNMVENIELEVMVNKADGRNLKTVELEQKYTDASEHTYTPDWLGLPSGQTWRYSSEYSVSTGSNVTLTKQDFTADGSLLTYAVSGGKAGDKITLTLKASCDNYGDFTITLNITLTEKDDQKPLTITGAGSVVYGQTLTLTTTGGSGTGTVTYRIDTDASTGEATIDPETGVLTPVKVGSVSVIATKAGDNDYNDVTSAPFVLMIKPATPTGEPSYTKITTSGKTLKDAALTTNGSTLNPNDGKLEWVNDKGNVLPDSTRVEANTTYKWRFTPTDTNYTTLTGEIELWHKSTSSGGGSYYAPVVPDMPMLYRGCTGDAVKTLQEKLNAKGFDSGNVDGIFGAKTYAAATAFQKANGLGVDGIVGKLTWAKLYDATPVNVTPVTTQPMLRTGSRGDAVRKLQELLNAKGYTCGSVDGIFGSKTYAAVLAFQKANGLGADGIVGPLTWGKLV